MVVVGVSSASTEIACVAARGKALHWCHRYVLPHAGTQRSLARMAEDRCCQCSLAVIQFLRRLGCLEEARVILKRRGFAAHREMCPRFKKAQDPRQKERLTL